MLELAFCLSMKYWSFIKFLCLAYNFIRSRLIPIENNEEKKATPKHFPKKILSQSPCKRQHVKTIFIHNKHHLIYFCYKNIYQ